MKFSAPSFEPINLQGQNGIRINPIQVYDAAKALVSSLGVSGNQIFNIAGNEEMSLLEICEIISDQQQIPAIFK